jgi:hypothetical protein
MASLKVEKGWIKAADTVQATNEKHEGGDGLYDTIVSETSALNSLMHLSTSPGSTSQTPGQPLGPKWRNCTCRTLNPKSSSLRGTSKASTKSTYSQDRPKQWRCTL